MRETPSPEVIPAYRQILRAELRDRGERHQGYSLRAFAKALEIDVATLSRTLSGKRPLSMKQALRIIPKLNLGRDDHRRFLESVAAHPAAGLGAEGGQGAQVKRHEIVDDAFEVVSNWHYFAILELTLVKHFQSNPRWIGKQLGISTVDARIAVDRLVKLNFLKRSDRGRLTKTYRKMALKYSDSTGQRFRRYQAQVLENARHSLENDPAPDRLMTSLAVAIDPKKIPKAREMIRKFAWELAAELETPSQERVYFAIFGLYPVQKRAPD